MDTVQVAIAEADGGFGQRLRQYFADFGQARDRRFEIVQFSSAEELSERYQPQFDLILVCLDPFAGAMAAVRRIRRQDEAVGIVLMSEQPQYALCGYEVGALGYLLKPTDYPAFLQQMDHVVHRLQGEACPCLSIPAMERTVRLKVERIGYLRRRGQGLTIRTCTNDYTFPIAMGQIGPALETVGFCYCNENELVNPTFVDRIEHHCVCIWGERLPLSLSREAGVMAALSRNTIILEGGLEEEQTAASALPN